MARYCGIVTVEDDCGHSTTVGYTNCGNHDDDESMNEECYNDTPKGTNNYMIVRRGMGECFYPCGVARSGWLCCECGFRKTLGWVDTDSDTPKHTFKDSAGNLHYHEFCNSCRVIDMTMDSQEDFAIYSGCSTLSCSTNSSSRAPRKVTFADDHEYARKHSRTSFSDDSGSHTSDAEPEPLRKTVHKPKVEPLISKMYDDLMSGKDVVLDLESTDDKRKFRHMLSALDACRLEHSVPKVKVPKVVVTPSSVGSTCSCESGRRTSTPRRCSCPTRSARG